MDDKARRGAAALLGLDGFVLTGPLEVDGELHQLVETRASRVGCSGCGVMATPQDRRTVKVRDLPAGGRPVVLEWAKRIWRCDDADCEVRTWSERTLAIAPRALLSERARRNACLRVGRDGHSVAQVARDLGVGWHTVMQAVWDYGEPLVDDPARTEGVVAMGLDETAFQRASALRTTSYVTGFVDLARSRLLDIVPGRSAKVVGDWLQERSQGWLEDIRVVALDPHRGYANGLLGHLDHATVVIDHFHSIKLANAAIDDVRRRVQQDTLGHRGRKDDPLYRIRRVLLRGGQRLGQRGWDRLEAGLLAGDPTGALAATWLGKERLREVYAAIDLAHARRLLVVFYQHCAAAEVPELTRLARTISAWQDEVLAFHTTHLSNGPTEAMNLLIKKIKRVGHGFRNLANYRLRLLLHCGVEWEAPRAVRLRGRPRSVA